MTTTSRRTLLLSVGAAALTPSVLAFAQTQPPAGPAPKAAATPAAAAPPPPYTADQTLRKLMDRLATENAPPGQPAAAAPGRGAAAAATPAPVTTPAAAPADPATSPVAAAAATPPTIPAAAGTTPPTPPQQPIDGGKEARARNLERAKERLIALAAIDRTRLSPLGCVDYDVIRYQQDRIIQLGMKFLFNGAPYVISHSGGAYRSTPSGLDQMAVTTKEQADAYLRQLKAFPAQLDRNLAAMKFDVEKGVMAPAVMCDMILEQLHILRDHAPDKTVLSASLAAKCAAAKLEGDFPAQAEKLVRDEVYPALDRHITAINDLKARTPKGDGVWRFPDGEAYYTDRLKAQTTTDMTPETVHQLGLQQVREISAKMNTLLRAKGYTRGSVGARMGALGRDPAQLYPNTEAGRTAALADMNRWIQEEAPFMPRAFARTPKGKVEVRRVSVLTEDSAANGSYGAGGPGLNGAPDRPGIFRINLKDMAEWPKFSLRSVTYHETSPGHHLQIALNQENTALHRYRRNTGSAGFTEGWALYAEQVMDEVGAYEGDPLGKLGYLQMQLFRAARMVVDSGLHFKRWDRARALRYMVETTGYAESWSLREINRYIAGPGQACSYKIGHTTFVRAREAAKAKLGPKFNLIAFHDTCLDSGVLPLPILERRVAAWVDAHA